VQTRDKTGRQVAAARQSSRCGFITGARRCIVEVHVVERKAMTLVGMVYYGALSGEG
jgi:hypothetical protein